MKSSTLVTEVEFRRGLMSAIFIPLFLAMTLPALGIWQMHRILQLEEQIDVTDIVIAHAARVEKYLFQLNAGLRGYLLTHRADTLRDYTLAHQELPNQLATLSELVADNLSQAQRVAPMLRAIYEWEDYKKMFVTSEDGEEIQSITSPVHKEGQRIMHGLESQVRDFLGVEEGVRLRRLKQLTFQKNVMWGGTGIAALGVLILGVWLMRTRYPDLLLAYSKSVRQTSLLKLALKAQPSANAGPFPVPADADRDGSPSRPSSQSRHIPDLGA